ncbi:ribonuclease HII [Govanella unica]|uniref:Ribonuclease HII n=1 Tax=Govanella unica TaxID=2975056 RepID=A0A9X3Z6N0_9PROT|nr:ribonuclease HII [Govania unica]MDA5193380.1 ribonuclease HII [Govania unica]
MARTAVALPADLLAAPSTGPNFLIEQHLGGVVCGIDEAGRGPWAGPVMAAAVVLDPGRVPVGINDSKKLSAAKREVLYGEILGCAQVGIGEASVEEIDELNILQATFLAMGRALGGLPTRPDHALVDGNRKPPLGIPATTVIKGDARSLSIAAASIIAKVFRDHRMTELAKIHPEYAWERNAGYGTAAHSRALAIVGLTPFHRRSFAPIRKLMTQES